MIGTVVAVVVILTLALILIYLPLEPTSFFRTADTAECGTVSPCGSTAVEFTLGDRRYSALTGTWMSNATAGDVEVTINNGPSNESCLLCSGLLYSSLLSIFPSGSFDVSGNGPFHVSITQLGFSPASTTVQGTVDSAVI